MGIDPLNAYSDGTTHDSDRRLEAEYNDLDNSFELTIKSDAAMLSSVFLQTMSTDTISDPRGLISSVIEIQYDKSYSFDSAKLVFDYSEADLTGLSEDGLTFMYINEETGKYEEIPSVVDKERKLITCEPTHFSAYAVGDKKAIANLISFNPFVTSIKYDGETYKSNIIALTGFNIKQHGFSFYNFASNTAGGQCAGFTFVSYLNFLSKLPVKRNGYLWKFNWISGYDLTNETRFQENKLYRVDEEKLFYADTDKNVDSFPFPSKLNKITEVLNCIKYWEGKQAESDFSIFTKTLNSKDEFDELYHRLKSGEPVPLALAAENEKGEKYLHYVLAYEIYCCSYLGNNYFISIYDSNYPGKMRYVLIRDKAFDSFYVEYGTKSVIYNTIRIAKIPDLPNDESLFIKHTTTEEETTFLPETTFTPETTITPETTVIPETTIIPETTVTPETSETLPPTEKLFAITGKIVKFDGISPYIDATVKIYNDSFTTTVSVDSSGAFSAFVPNGDYNVAISAPEDIDSRFAVTEGYSNCCHVSDNSVDLGLFRISKHLRGMVVDGTPDSEGYGKPLDGVTIQIIDSNGNDVSGVAIPSVNYDNSGNKTNYSLRFNSPGKYKLIFSKEGYQDHILENYSITNDTVRINDVSLVKIGSVITPETTTIPETTAPSPETTVHEHVIYGNHVPLDCNNERIQVMSCECGYSYTRVLPPSEHVFIDSKCSVCGYGSSSLEIKTWSNYCEVVGIGTCTDENIVIPDTYGNLPVTKLSDEAFRGCDNIKSVYIPASIIEITGSRFTNSPFRDCTSLEKIEVHPDNPVMHSDGNCLIVTDRKLLIAGCKNSVIPDDGSVTVIGFTAFCGTEIESLVIPDTITNVGMSAFYNCNSLTSLYLPASSMQHLDAPIFLNRFQNCPLNEVIIGNDFTDMEKLDFETIRSLSCITLGNGITTICTNDFNNLPSLTTVNLKKSIKKIEKNAFNNCGSLTTIKYDGTVAEWNAIEKEDGWYNRTTDLITVYCSDGIDEIGNKIEYEIKNGILTISGKGAISDYSNGGAPWASFDGEYTKIVIEEGITEIGNYAFSECKSFTSIVLPNTLTRIGHYAFWHAYGLTDITIPENVSSIGKWALIMTDLTNIFVDKDNEYYCDIDGVLFTKDKKTLIRYPKKKVGESYTVPSSVTIIDEYAFSQTQLKTVILPENLQSIKQRAFWNSNIETITIPDGITELGHLTFEYCYSLTSVYFMGNAPLSMGDSVFASGSDSLVLYYISGKNGWNSPTWIGPDGKEYNTKTFVPLI